MRLQIAFKCLGFFLAASLLGLHGGDLLAFPSSAQDTTVTAQLGKRHIYILEAVKDPEEGLAVRVTYIFGIQVSEQATGEERIYPLIPKNVDDFRPLEGASPEQFKTDEEGRVYMHGSPGEGMQMIALGMIIRTKARELELPLLMTDQIETLEFLWTDGMLELDGPSLSAVESVSMGDRPYSKRVWQSAGSGAEAALIAPSGHEVNFVVKGLPEGRQAFWLMASALAAILLGLAVALTLRTRPVLSGDGLGRDALV
jgi:hypothetical protein